jgi:hypothetical protein
MHASSGIRTRYPAFEQAKSVLALDSAATVIGSIIYCIYKRKEGASWSVSGVDRYIIITNLLHSIRSRDSIVGITTGYGLDDRGGRSSSPGGSENFLHVVQTASGVHPHS